MVALTDDEIVVLKNFVVQISNVYDELSKSDGVIRDASISKIIKNVFMEE